MLDAKYTLRPPQMTDAELVASLITTYNDTLKMPELMTAKALFHLWKRPQFDLNQDAWVILDGNQVVAYTAVEGMPPYDFIFYWGCDHPDYFGQGLRQELLTLAEQRIHAMALHAEPDVKSMMRTYITGADEAGCAALVSNGWELESRYLVMEMPLSGKIAQPEFPAHFTIKPLDPQNESQVRMVYDAEQEAFADQTDTFHSPSFDIWKARMTLGNFDENLWVLAMDGDELAGFTICQANRNRPYLGWIRVIGVRPAWRKQGLGIALMRQSFLNLQAAGMDNVGLQVHDSNPTGAQKLYERAGMAVIASKNYYVKPVVR